MLLKNFPLLLAINFIVSSGSCQNHTITAPGFFFNVDGNPAQNPTISMQVGSTNILTITTPGIHPVAIAKFPDEFWRQPLFGRNASEC